ncbi:hypothetical protein [Streptomyces sp. NPDC002550]
MFHFTGTPQVELSSATADGRADADTAWGAVAFQPLASKPANMVVVMADSYSSGEGATAPGGADLYPETDHHDKLNDAQTDKCHRSKLAWSRQATLPGYGKSIGSMADSFDPEMDYHFVTCSGARTYNVLDKQQGSGEVPQIQAGYLDDNTTLVTLSIGGNDARFSDIVAKCSNSTTRARSWSSTSPTNCAATASRYPPTPCHLTPRTSPYCASSSARASDAISQAVVPFADDGGSGTCPVEGGHRAVGGSAR